MFDETVIKAFYTFVIYLLFTDLAIMILDKVTRFAISLIRQPLLQSWYGSENQMSMDGLMTKAMKKAVKGKK